MEISASTGPSLSLESFEKFIENNPDAQNIVVSEGHIIAGDSVKDLDHGKTKEAFKAALKTKYPDQETLVEEAWKGLQTSGEAWNAHTIRQVIDKAAENANAAIWKNVDGNGAEEKGIAEEKIAELTKAIDDYAEQIIEKLSPEEQESLRQQLITSGLFIGGAGVAGLATNISTPAANAALSNLLATISSSLPATAPANHLAAASAALGTATINSTAHAALVSATQAASAVVPFIIVGAIAHRLFIATSRIASTASKLEHEINNVTTAMLAAALATIPPAQHAVLVAAIFGGILGQHLVDPGLIEKACHNLRDAALGVYLVKHPEIAISIGHGIKSLLLSATNSVASTAGSAIATTTTTAATTATTTTSSTSVAAGTLAHTAPVMLSHSSMAAVAAHGVSTAATVVGATISAHPILISTVIVGGACAAAYNYVSSSPSERESATA